MNKKFKYKRQSGFIAWIITSLMFFVLALLIQKFSLLGANLDIENEKDQLFYWANLIFERAETNLYKQHLTVDDVANWKFTDESLDSSKRCLSFSEIYQQRQSSQVLNSEDFYPPQIKHWNRIDKSSQNQINNKYKNYCYKIELELISKLDDNLSETHDPNLLLLIVNVINKASNSGYVKRGFISRYKSIDNYEI